jgi:hypothetical protein
MNTQENKGQDESVIIANPIYDIVFKTLMENKRVAKFFFETMLEEPLLDINLRHKTITYKEGKKVKDMPGGISCSTFFQLDFVGTVNRNGREQELLLKLQKARNENNFVPVRSDYRDQYVEKEYIDGDYYILPTSVIYMVGFKVPNLKIPVLCSKRTCTDLLGEEIFTEMPRFFDNVSHDYYIFQTKMPTERYTTKLDKLRSIFEQAHFVQDSEIAKLYPYNAADDEDIQYIISLLQKMISDPEVRKKIEMEDAVRISEEPTEKVCPDFSRLGGLV